MHLLRFYSRILGDFTRDDSQRRVLAQHRVTIWNSVATIWNNVAAMLQSCVALNIVVANRPVQHHLQKCFMYWSWGKILVAFLKLLYAIWTFRLFINDSSCYVRVFRKCECAKRFICHYGPQAMKFEPAPIIRPKCFDPLVTVLTGFHCSKRS